MTLPLRMNEARNDKQTNATVVFALWWTWWNHTLLCGWRQPSGGGNRLEACKWTNRSGWDWLWGKHYRGKWHFTNTACYPATNVYMRDKVTSYSGNNIHSTGIGIQTQESWKYTIIWITSSIIFKTRLELWVCWCCPQTTKPFVIDEVC